MAPSLQGRIVAAGGTAQVRASLPSRGGHAHFIGGACWKATSALPVKVWDMEQHPAARLRSPAAGSPASLAESDAFYMH